ncbi:MAG: transglutaminase domain-containing protein [Bacteroidales bacterium]|nr:transglutaminase domain-containing protein [Bacteroidales bacterium]
MKRIIAVLAMTILILPLKAQVNQKESYEEYRNRMRSEMRRYNDAVKQDYENFRQKANEEYAQFMRERWEEYQSLKGDPTPEIPEPPQPYERERDKEVLVPKLPIKFDQVITLPKPEEKPKEPEKRPTPVVPNTPSVPEFNFVCYGTSCTVHMDKNLKFKLKDCSEQSVADVWDQLTSETFEVLLEDCLNLREELALGDWAYFCLIRDLSETFLGKETNEAVLFETYLMAQSGYKLRIGRKDNNLILMLPFDNVVYETVSITLDGVKYYVIDNGKTGGYYVFNRSFMDNERILSLRMKQAPKFAFKSGGEKTFVSKRYPDLKVTMAMNKNLMDFYTNYPKTLWTNYSWVGLSDDVKAKLYPMLRKGIEGKSQIEAANRLINFVQTAFEYKTDGQQFGYERSFFPDETFFYPYSDCEDRSILFSVLMRDLLHVDVALLHYPDHLATAVHYTETLQGTYFTMDGKTFYVSDPTYIGANVGECMPRYVNTNPKVYLL